MPLWLSSPVSRRGNLSPGNAANLRPGRLRGRQLPTASGDLRDDHDGIAGT
jgi:hypothetical protein